MNLFLITEAQIKAAVRVATTADKPRLELRDGGMRGAGRLVVIIRGNGDAAAPTSEFYACWYRDGHRRMSKLGTYPLISLADAGKRFREEFAPASPPAPSPPESPAVSALAEPLSDADMHGGAGHGFHRMPRRSLSGTGAGAPERGLGSSESAMAPLHRRGSEAN
jgi:hypothetical protein